MIDLQHQRMTAQPEFKDVLRNWMTSVGATRRDVAHMARVSKRDVKLWEAGVEAPLKEQLSRLRRANSAFEHCRVPDDNELAERRANRVLDKTKPHELDVRPQAPEPRKVSVMKDESIAPEAAKAIHELHRAHEANDNAPSAAPGDKMPFNIALRDIAKARGDTHDSLAASLSKTVGPTSRSSIWRWMKGGFPIPTKFYEALVQRYPSLYDAAMPTITEEVAGRRIAGLKKARARVSQSQHAAHQRVSQRRRHRVRNLSWRPTGAAPAPTLLLPEIKRRVLETLTRLGPDRVLGKEMYADLAKQGITVSQAGDAKRRLKIESWHEHREGHLGPWWWIRTDQTPTIDEVANEKPSPQNLGAQRKALAKLNGSTALEAIPADADQPLFPKPADQRRHGLIRDVQKREELPIGQKKPKIDLKNLRGQAVTARLAQAKLFAPIKLPMIPAQFDQNRYVPAHAVNQFRDRYLGKVRYDLQTAVYMIDWLVQNSINKGWWEIARYDNEELRIIAVPGLEKGQMFLALVRNNQIDGQTFSEVILTFLPEDEKGDRFEKGISFYRPFASLAEEFAKVVRLVPTKTPTTRVIQPETQRRPITVEEIHRKPAMPSAVAVRSNPTPTTPIKLSFADAGEAGMALAKALSDLKERREKQIEFMRGLSAIEDAVTDAEATVKAIRKCLQEIE